MLRLEYMTINNTFIATLVKKYTFMDAKNTSALKHSKRRKGTENEDFNKIIDLIRHGSNFNKMDEVKRGVSRHVLDGLKDLTSLDLTSLSKIVGTTTATIHKKRNDQKFNLAISEKIIEVAALYDFGYEVFEDKNTFDLWMRTDNNALGQKKPIEFIDTIFGVDEVRKIIGRIQYGVYS
jgi:putative toxin-antitoxin system antitoxin component (TIGR02293 family)